MLLTRAVRVRVCLLPQHRRASFVFPHHCHPGVWSLSICLSLLSRSLQMESLDYDALEMRLSYDSLWFCRSLANAYLQKSESYRESQLKKLQEERQEQHENSGWVSYMWSKATASSLENMVDSLELTPELMKTLEADLDDEESYVCCVLCAAFHV
jgi:ABC-type microcin C transport system permease subunit YejE